MIESTAGRNARVITRFTEILLENRMEELDEVMTEDFVQEIPQSGETVRGLGNARAIMQNYPGQDKSGLRAEGLRIFGDEPHYVMSPTFNVVRVEGSGDHPIVVLKAIYPDGSIWWVISFITMRGDKMARSVDYYAPTFPPPEWRAAWVEVPSE